MELGIYWLGFIGRISVSGFLASRFFHIHGIYPGYWCSTLNRIRENVNKKSSEVPQVSKHIYQTFAFVVIDSKGIFFDVHCSIEGFPAILYSILPQWCSSTTFCAHGTLMPLMFILNNKSQPADLCSLSLGMYRTNGTVLLIIFHRILIREQEC